MSMLKAKISAALNKIGTTNGTAPKPSQDPLDALAHEYNVASAIFSIAEKRKEVAKASLLAGLSEQNKEALEKRKQMVQKTNISDGIDLGIGAHNSVSAVVKIGGSFLNEAKLRVEMKKTMSSDEVDKLFASCTERRAPSVTIQITELEPE
jgi:hypothetical protein